MSARVDAAGLAAELIRRPSVTPKDEGAIDLLAGTLEQLGFTCHRLVFDGDGGDPIHNLYARRGAARPNLCFAGHTDVVPPGAREAWSCDPFAASSRDGELWGRGAVDMKGAIAAFVAAAQRWLDARGPAFARKARRSTEPERCSTGSPRAARPSMPASSASRPARSPSAT
jgi:succinyl-diaminopimelate desuccinylase